MLTVVFFEEVNYNCQIMSFEAHEEMRIERQVDAIFESVSTMTVRERMGVAAFDLLELIETERLAQDEVQREWFERDKDARQIPRKSRYPFGKAILEGFAGLGHAVAWGAYVIPPVYDYRSIPAEEIPDELLDTPTSLERARIQISMAKEVLPDVYNLTPKQMKKAEKIARSLKR
jgi:hypothetical protein